MDAKNLKAGERHFDEEITAQRIENVMNQISLTIYFYSVLDLDRATKF